MYVYCLELIAGSWWSAFTEFKTQATIPRSSPVWTGRNTTIGSKQLRFKASLILTRCNWFLEPWTIHFLLAKLFEKNQNSIDVQMHKQRVFNLWRMLDNNCTPTPWSLCWVSVVALRCRQLGSVYRTTQTRCAEVTGDNSLRHFLASWRAVGRNTSLLAVQCM